MDLILLLFFLLFVVASIVYAWSSFLNKKKHSRKKSGLQKFKKIKKEEKVELALPVISKRHKSQTDEMITNAQEMSRENPDKVATMLREWMKDD